MRTKAWRRRFAMEFMALAELRMFIARKYEGSQAILHFKTADSDGIRTVS